MQMNEVNVAFMKSGARIMPEQRMNVKVPRGRGEVILAIEDEEMLRDFLETILGEDGYRVILAADGSEGVRTYEERMQEISLVILDMGLPRMSGEDVLAQIVSLSPDARVIAVSGSIEPDVEAAALRRGAAAYIPKPYMTEELLRKVYHTLHSAE